MKNFLFLFCLSLLLVSCEDTTEGDKTTTANQSTDNSSEMAREANGNETTNSTEKGGADQNFEALGKELDFVGFNTKIKTAIETNEEWASSPLSIMLNFTGADMDSNVKSVRSKKLGPGENIQDVMVTVEEDGLMDDSVSGTITILRMKKEEGIWQVYKATQAWKCWKGRGHETYSSVPCN